MKRMIGVCMTFILMVSLTACQNTAPQISDSSGQTSISQIPSTGAEQESADRETSDEEAFNGENFNGEISNEETAVVYFTSNISSEGLVAVYEALEWEPTGKVAVKLSTGEWC